ncbi:unnamed protein product [Lampetra fluviatilis]
MWTRHSECRATIGDELCPMLDKKEKLFPCSDCSYGATQKSKLKRHILSVHHLPFDSALDSDYPKKRRRLAFKPAAATVSDYDVTNGSEEEESGSVESEAKSDSESEDEETSDSSGDEEDCQKFALAPSTYEVEEKTDEVEGNIDEAEEKKDEVLEEVASGIVADADGAAASEECRRREFGIGIKLSKDAAQLMEVQQSICPRSSPAKTRTSSRSS